MESKAQMATSANSLDATRRPGFMKRGRERFLDRHVDADDAFLRLFSGTTYALWRVSRELFAKHCKGLVLDAGAGRGTWSKTALKTASAYESIDLASRGDHRPTWTGDIAAMPEVPNDQYDTVVCQQVLEHVPRPWRVLAELHRVMKPGGTLLLSVPHLSRRHELPHDYFRYTQDGLASLLADAGFEAVEVRPYGGVLCFLHHQTSFFFPGLLAGIPIVGAAALWANAAFSWLTVVLDSLIDRGALMPLGVMIAARKPRRTDRPAQGRKDRAGDA